MKHGFLKTAAAVCDLITGDVAANTKSVISLINKAAKQGVELLCFSELTLTGSELGDNAVFCDFLAEAEEALLKVKEATAGKNMIVSVGLPMRVENKLYNITAVLKDNEILGIVPKTKLTAEEKFFSAATDDDDFDFEIWGDTVPFTPNLILKDENGEFSIAFEAGAEYSDAIPPSVLHAMAGANVIVCPSAHPESAGGHDRTIARLRHSSAHLRAAFVYANISGAHSRASYSGSAAIVEAGCVIAENRPYAMKKDGLIVTDIDCGYLNNLRLRKPLAEIDTESYEEVYTELDAADAKLDRKYSASPFVDDIACHFENIDDIVTDAIYRRYKAAKADKLFVGLSGGVDSTMTLLFAYNTCIKYKIDTRKIVAVTMPSAPTSSRTYQNALKLAPLLNVSLLDISIEKAFKSHLVDIKHTGIEDKAYENAQARERTQILLDLCNKDNGLMLGTCDMSEFTLGWATFGGDHICHFNPNCNITKTQIQAILKHTAGKTKNRELGALLHDIVCTPISPELKSDQKTEDTIGPYELIDFFLYHYLYKGQNREKTQFLAETVFAEQYKKDFIDKCLYNFIRRFKENSFKRNCSPDSPSVQEFNISEVYLPSVN